MKKIILPLFVIAAMAIIAPAVFASNLKISKNADFSSSDLNFSGGEKIYVMVESDGSGSSQKVLNIRDNQYNLISSVELKKSGNQFTASFKAPDSQGYFSLEAVVEGDGNSSKSVKTIKVGSPTSANVRVNVKSSVKGEKINNANENKLSDNKEENNSIKDESSGEAQQEIEVFKAEEKPQNKGIWRNAISWVKVIFHFVWPFD